MDDTDSDLNRSLLIFLVALYEQRHLGRTATRLSISLPKASRQLSAARRIFGDPLYVRFGQGLAPTARAHEVTAQARSVLEEMRRLFEDRTFRPEEMTRVVRVLCLDNAIPIVIEPLVDALFAKAPKAGLALEPHSEETFLRLQAGDADMAVFPAVHLPEGFRSVTLLRTPYVHAVRAGHPLEAQLEQGRLSPADLRRFRRIQICVHPDVDDTAEGVPGPARIPLRAAETMLWTESWLGAARLMHRTDAVLTLPWRTALRLSEERPLTVLSRAQSVPWLEPALVWHCHSETDTALEWVRSLVITTVRGGMAELKADEMRTGRLGG